MTRRLTATIGLGALALTGGALTMLPAQAAQSDPAQRQADVSIGDQGQVNIAGTGLVPVVIHGGDSIDAATVDPTSIVVGDGVEPVRTSTGGVIANLVDMDGDGSQDLVVHVDQANLRGTGDLTSDVAPIQVTADAADGTTVQGVASVRPEAVLEVKFTEASQGQSLAAAEDALAGYDVRQLSPFLNAAASRRLDANTVGTAADAASAPDLASWYTLTLPADTDVTEALTSLRALPEIDYAGRAPGMAPPPEQPATPDFRGLQRYFRTAAENGIDADFSRADLRTRGEGIKIVDLEYDWNEHHEDLQLPDPGTDVGGDAFDKYKGFNDQHGTAVFGILGALDNDFGVTGGVPDAELYGISPTRSTGGYAPGPALAYLAALQDESGASFLQPGDAVLLEQQGGQVIPNADCPVRAGTCYSPLEWNVAVHDAVSLLTSMGVTVIATGGNGYNSTENPAYTRDGLLWFRPENSSGSIFEGAGDADTRDKLGFSNYGSRFDLQGWGNRITSTGHGGTSTNFWPTTGGGDPATLNYRYTGSFGGTSGGGPIVTTAVVAIQSYRLATGQKPWSAQRIADLLKETGQPQGPNSLAQHIGPLPNIRGALIEIEVDRPITTLRLDGQAPADRSYSDPVVSLEATDGWGSGVKRTMYRIDDIPRWFLYNEPFQVTSAGEHTIQYRSNDFNDNTERTLSVTFVNE